MPSNKVQINDAMTWEVPDSQMDVLEGYLNAVGRPGMPDDGKAEASMPSAEEIRERLEGKSATKAILDKIMADPWAHRSTGMRCKTCMFFVPKLASIYARPIGRCRRHAPTMNGYPAVYPDDWCGDHKVDESKLAGPLDNPVGGASCPGGAEVRMPLTDEDRLNPETTDEERLAGLKEAKDEAEDYGRAELDKMRAETRLINAQAHNLELQGKAVGLVPREGKGEPAAAERLGAVIGLLKCFMLDIREAAELGGQNTESTVQLFKSRLGIIAGAVKRELDRL